MRQSLLPRSVQGGSPPSLHAQSTAAAQSPRARPGSPPRARLQPGRGADQGARAGQACGSGRSFCRDVEPQLQPPSELWRYELDLTGGRAASRRRLCDRVLEFPAVHPHCQGARRLASSPMLPTGQGGAGVRPMPSRRQARMVVSRMPRVEALSGALVACRRAACVTGMRARCGMHASARRHLQGRARAEPCPSARTAWHA